MQNIPSVMGIELEEAKRRLRDVGAIVNVTFCSSRKGVCDADSARIIRQRVYETDEDGLRAELIAADFKTKII